MHYHSKKLNKTAFFACMLTTFSITACDKAPNNQAHGFAAPVDYQEITSKDIPVISSLIGRATAVRTAEVRPQVSGVILKRFFTEGSVVNQGDQLYQIDPAMYEAQLASAKASIAQAEANLYSSKLRYDRFSKLINTNAISKQDYDDALASNKAAEAQVLAAKAAVKTAEINLAYTKVYAPITGTIGRSNVTEGALVTNSQVTPMATIQQLDPIYVDLGLSVTEHLNMKKNMAEGLFNPNNSGSEQVELFLENGEKLEQKGSLEFSEVTVDESTGMVNVRVKVPNHNQYILPGMYIKANVNQGIQKNVLLVPQVAVLRQNNGTNMVYTIKSENNVNTVEQHNIVINGEYEHDYIVVSGIKKNDRVITTNLQKIGPGAPVTPIDKKPQTENSDVQNKE